MNKLLLTLLGILVVFVVCAMLVILSFVAIAFAPRPVLHLLRRAGKAAPPAEILRGGEITLDRNGRLVQVDARTVNLTPSEFDLLAALMSAPGRAFSRLVLLDVLQGVAYEGYERTIDVHIRNLRTKIEADPSQPRYVETVYGHGYRFSSDV